ncbi:MAG: sigma-70 family RNA polymerase sigma factor [Gammaproteobacteria bacterium]
MESQTDIFMKYIQTHRKALHIVARQYVMSEADASDLVQETLLKAWKSFSSTEEKEYSRAWLFAIMRNVALDWQKMNKRRIKLSPVPHSELTEIAASNLNEPLCQMPVMDEERFLQFVDDHIVAALDAIDPVFREVIILSAAGGLKYNEIAQVLDCPMGTVMSRMARARRMLRERLAGSVRKPKEVTRRKDEVERS